MTSSSWAGGMGGGVKMVKNGKNSDGSGCLQGGEEGIHRNWKSTAIISVSVIRVQTVPDRCLVLL